MARPAAAGAVPAELNDSPYEILTRFQYALKDAANPEAPAVPLQVRGHRRRAVGGALWADRCSLQPAWAAQGLQPHDVPLRSMPRPACRRHASTAYTHLALLLATCAAARRRTLLLAHPLNNTHTLYPPPQDMPMDIADIANTDNLALFKYYVTPQQWDRFCAGAWEGAWVLRRSCRAALALPRCSESIPSLLSAAPTHRSPVPRPPPAPGDMDEDEQNELADKLAAALVADDRHRARQAGVAAAVRCWPGVAALCVPGLAARCGVQGTAQARLPPPLPKHFSLPSPHPHTAPSFPTD